MQHAYNPKTGQTYCGEGDIALAQSRENLWHARHHKETCKTCIDRIRVFEEELVKRSPLQLGDFPDDQWRSLSGRLLITSERWQ